MAANEKTSQYVMRARLASPDPQPALAFGSVDFNVGVPPPLSTIELSPMYRHEVQTPRCFTPSLVFIH